MDGQLQLRLLGMPEIKRGEAAAIGFSYRKSLALLAYLAVTGRAHSRAALADLLWGEANEANARAGLRKSLAELRSMVGPHLDIARHEVAFICDHAYRLDVKQFEKIAQPFLQDQGSEISPAQVEALAAALDLYQGEFLAGFHVRRAPVFEEWLLLERERLRLAALRMAFALSIHHMTEADYLQAIAYTERVLGIEPSHEEAHRQMMSLLALSGQQAAALHQYELCRQALETDLGVAPDVGTAALYRRIRDGDPCEDRDSVSSRQLSTPSASFIGRKEDVVKIGALLSDPRCRLLTLLGPGGSGKTRLAKEIGAIHMADGEINREAGHEDETDNVYYVSLGSISSVESLMPTMAHGVGCYFFQESRPHETLLSHLRHQRAVLILDGCEALLERYDNELGSLADVVESILAAAPGVTILATSRARFNLPYETLFPINGMAYPEYRPENPQDLCGYDAVRLFLWQMHRVQPHLEPNSSDLIAIGDLCRTAVGLPLEILLMANWTRLLTPAEILTQLSDEVAESGLSGMGNLARNSCDGGPSLKQHLREGLAPIFDRSWKLLTAEEQRTLAMLTAFRGGFNYPAARATSGVSMRGLMSLLDQSMVVRMESDAQNRSQNVTTTRFDIHDLLRDYIEARPEMAGTLGVAREQQCIHFMTALQQWVGGLQSDREQVTLRTMDIEIANVRIAWDWAVKQGRFDLLEQGMEGLCRYYQLRFRFFEGESACSTAFQTLTPTLRNHQRFLAAVQSWRSWFTTDRAQAVVDLEDSITNLDCLSAIGVDVVRERARAFHMLGLSLLHIDMSRSRQVLEKSLSIYRSLNDEWQIAKVLGHLHMHAWEAGAHEDGRRVAEEALALYGKIGYQKGYAGILGDRGIGALQAGQVEIGMQAIQESVDIFQKLGDRAGMAKGLYFGGMALGFLGQWDEAECRLQASAKLAAGNSNFAETVLISLAIVQTHQGRHAEARDHAEMGLERARDVKNQMCIGRSQTALALSALAAGESDKAKALAEQAISTYRNFGQETELGMALAALGFALCQSGESSQAGVHFREALRLASARHDQVSLLYALAGFAHQLSCSGRVEQAVEIDALAAQHPFVAKSVWFSDMVRHPIERAAMDYPPETIAAAVERGRTGDLAATVASLARA